jgi:hypothetical protein
MPITRLSRRITAGLFVNAMAVMLVAGTAPPVRAADHAPGQSSKIRVRVIDVGGRPTQVAIDPRRGTAWVATGRELVRIREATQRVTARVRFGGSLILCPEFRRTQGSSAGTRGCSGSVARSDPWVRGDRLRADVLAWVPGWVTRPADVELWPGHAWRGHVLDARGALRYRACGSEDSVAAVRGCCWSCCSAGVARSWRAMVA